jgi:hypothetical protein
MLGWWACVQKSNILTSFGVDLQYEIREINGVPDETWDWLHEHLWPSHFIFLKVTSSSCSTINVFMDLLKYDWHIVTQVTKSALYASLVVL